MKDPAALFFIDKYLAATAEMPPDCVGWYTKLLLHQYDKIDLPNDVELLAGLCNVRFSDFERFKHVFKHMLSEKFELNENGRLANPFACEILKKRKDFKEQRSKSGTVGYLMKLFYKEKLGKLYDTETVKVYLYSLDNEFLETLKDKQEFKHVLKQNDKLYINVDIDITNATKNKGGRNKNEKTVNDIPIYEDLQYPFDSEQFKEIWKNWKIYKFSLENKKFMYASIQSEQSALVKLAKLAGGDEPTAIEIMTNSMSNGWAGFFEIKKDNHNGGSKKPTGGAVDTRSAFEKIDRMFS